MPTVLVICAIALLLASSPAGATPQFARQYGVACARCHVSPPMLNRDGEDFLARGYRFDTADDVRRTIPLAVWNTVEVEHQSARDLTKGVPSRVELISSGPFARRAFYFVELRALSQQIGAGGRLLNRSGRFEDLFVGSAFGPSGAMSVTVGQFRTVSQVDVSRRLSLSEPLAFSASVAGEPARAGARLTALRSFSPSGRQPGIRLAFVRPGERAADGWQSAVTLPFTGELTIPFAEAASFELEGRPKGVFVESFYRVGWHSAGGHAFVGDDRSLAHAVVTGALAERVFITGAAGYQRAGRVTRGRLSIGGDVRLTRVLMAGARADHLTTVQARPSVFVYLNAHVPLGPSLFRQALRLQVEQRIQQGDHRTTLALGHVF
ncbi:MAG: hypothetical protein ACRD26_08975 [Vicinamibacterales bacterium]